MTRRLYGSAPYDPNNAEGLTSILTGYAQACRDLAETKGVALIDVYSAYEAYAAQEGQAMEALLSDGMHPSDAGHQVTARLLLEAIVSLTSDARHAGPDQAPRGASASE
jgi:lysophospholipase L1-like esterase